MASAQRIGALYRHASSQPPGVLVTRMDNTDFGDETRVEVTVGQQTVELTVSSDSRTLNVSLWGIEYVYEPKGRRCVYVKQMCDLKEPIE